MSFSKWNVLQLIFNARPYGLISKHLRYAVSLLQDHCAWTWYVLYMKGLLKPVFVFEQNHKCLSGD